MPRFSKIGFATLILVAGLAIAIALHYLRRPDLSAAASADSTPVDPQSQAVPAQSETDSVNSTFPAVEISASDDQLLDLARSMVNRSPLAAVEWARSQSDPILRRRLLSAAIRAWAENDPNIAVDWALAQDDDERRIDLEAALAGAVKQPQLALAIVRGLFKNYDPSDNIGAGPALVLALDNAGHFQTALEFINSGPAECRAEWTRATFQRWGASHPQEAIQALNAIPDDQLRRNAFEALVNGWSTGDLPALADYAKSLPDGNDRAYAFNKTVENWSLQDPAAMGEWLLNFPRGTDFDQAVATLISRTDSVNRSPEVAMQWAENISDPDLKYQTAEHVLNEWNRMDPAAARNYATSASWLNLQERQALLSILRN